MTIRLAALGFDARNPQRLAHFWAEMLGRAVAEGGAVVGAPTDVDFDIRFRRSSEPKSGLNRMHVDLTSESAADQQETVTLALALGARHLDVGQRGDEGHVVLADPEGNEFCVIEPGNAFLADTARIGALAGDGTSRAGCFWSEVLGWPLVWDQDEETAIQSPQGGTKLTWGGPPLAPKQERNRLRFLLAVDGHIENAAERLVARGATRPSVALAGPGLELADPDGNEFELLPAASLSTS